jgi:hypothetical protein
MSKSQDEIELARRIALEDHLFKCYGTAPLLIALDRLAWPEGDTRRNNRLKKGAEVFVGWYGEQEKAKNVAVTAGTGLLRKDFSAYISEIKKQAAQKQTEER